jgi:tetratricopeptide (TPR) repeat protein
LDLRAQIRRYRAESDPCAWLEAAERAAIALPSASARAAALSSLAGLREEVDFEPDRAAALHRRAFMLTPDDTAPLAHARELATRLARFELAAELGELELSSSAVAAWPPARLGELAAAVGELYLLLGNRAAAHRWLARASEALPESARLKDALAAACHDADDWRGEVEGLREGASSVGDARLAARILLRAVRILHLVPAHAHERERALRALLDGDGTCAEGHVLLEQLLAHTERWDALAAHRSARLEACPSPHARVALLRTYARSWQRAGDTDRAGAALLQAWTIIRRVAERPGAEPPLRLTIGDAGFLCDWLEARGQYQRLVTLAEPGQGDLDEPALDDAALTIAARASDVACARLHDRATAEALAARVHVVAREIVLLVDDSPRVAAPAAPGSDDQASEAARALEASGASTERILAAWRAAIAAAPRARAPRRELARVLRTAQRWYALIEALRDEEGECEGQDERAHLGLEMVEIYRDRLRLDSMVPSILEPLLDRQPGSVALLDELAAWAERTNHPADLIAALTRKLPLVADDGERLQLQLRMARLHAAGADAACAIEAWERVLALDPAQPEALRELEAAYEKRRDWEHLVGLRARVAALLPDPEARLAATVEVARQARERLRRPALVVQAWNDVLALDPCHREALDELVRLLEVEGDWARVGQLRMIQLEEAADQAEKLTILSAIGVVYGEKLGDADGQDRAILAWREVLWIDPRHARASEALRKHLAARARWDELEELYLSADQPDALIKLLERQVELVDDPAAKAALLGRVATLCVEALGKPERALPVLERLLTLAPDDLSSADRLVALCEPTGDRARLARALELRLRAGGDDAGERATRLGELAILHEQLDDLQAAYRFWIEALEADPARDPALHAAERLARVLVAWQPLRQALARVTAPGRELEPARALTLLMVSARLAEEELGDTAAAVAALREVLALDARHEPALVALARVHEARGELAELRAVHERELEIAADPARQRQLRARLGRLYVEAGEWDRATATYRDALASALDSSSRRETLRALAGLYARERSWPALEEVLVTELSLAPADAQVLLELAELRDQQLGDLGAALGAYRDLLLVEPAHAAAIAALERALAVPALEHAAARALEPVYERRGASERVAAMCEAMLRHEPQTLERASLLYRLADLHQRRGDAPAALDALGRLVAEDPYDATTLAHLERLAEKTQAWAGLIQLFRAVLSKPLPLATNITFRCRLGHLYADRLGEPERAITAFERVLDLDAQNPEALAALTGLYQRAERRGDLAAVLERRLAGTPTPAERLGLLEQLGRLCQELGDPVRARAAWQEAHQLAPEALPPLHALVSLERAAGATAALADTLRALLRACERTGAPLAPGEQLAILIELARLESAIAGHEPAALAAWIQALALAPDDDETLAALEQLHRASQRWPDCERITTRRAEVCAARGDVAAAVVLLVRAAELCEHELGAPERAAALSEQVCQHEPGHAEASACLERCYRTLARWDRLVAVLEARAARASDVADAVAWLVEAAQLREQRMDDAVGAFATLVTALDRAPGSREVLARLEPLAATTGRWDDLCVLVAGAAESLGASDRERAAELWLELARWHEHERAAPEAAHAAVTTALGLARTSPPVMAAAVRLLRRRGAFAELAVVLRDAAALEVDSARRFRYLVDLADLLAGELADLAGAIEAYGAALELDPDDADVLDALAGLHARQGDWEAMVRDLERQARCSEGEPRARLFERIVELCEGVLGDRERAADVYVEWLAVDPAAEAALAGLVRLYATGRHPEQLLDVLAGVGEPRRGLLLEDYLERLAASEHWSGLVAVLDRLAADEPDPIVRAGHRRAAGALRRDELGQPEHALDDLEAALDDYLTAADGGLPEAAIRTFQAIDELLTARADWHALERAYRHMIERIPTGTGGLLLATFWENLGGIYRNLGDAEAADGAFASAARILAPAGGDAAVELNLLAASDYSGKALRGGEPS